MSSPAQSPENNPERQDLNPSFNPAEYELPSRYRQEETIPCMLFSEYSKEARAALESVQEKVRQWFGENSSHEDAGRLFDMSMTVFLTPDQHTELMDLIQDTPLEAHTLEDFADAIARGISGEAPYVDPEGHGRSMKQIDRMTNAGRAIAELTANPDMEWEQRRTLAYDIWNGMIQVHNFAGSMIQNINTDIRAALIAEAKRTQPLDERGNASREVYEQINERAYELTGEYARQSERVEEAQRITVPLANALLGQDSPILKEIVYTQFGSNYDYLGRALDLYGSDPAAMLGCLDDWEAFWDTQVPLLSSYFEESAAEREQWKQAVAEGASKDDKPNSKWRCSAAYQGDKAALAACKWDETVFNELRNEHLWGVKLMGIPGPVGDRAFEIVTGVLERANAEAEICRPAYAVQEAERDMGRIPNLDSIPEESREMFRRHMEQVMEEAAEKAGNLVHGISDLLISGLPWNLPREDAPLGFDPALHLERSLDLLEQSFHSDGRSTGLKFCAKMAIQEFAIQLSIWSSQEVLDQRPDLAARATQIFDEARVGRALPGDWCTSLRDRGILPPAEEEQE
jgi:hypothetical protein